MRQDHAEVEVRLFQVDPQGIAVQQFKAGDVGVVIEMTGFLGLRRYFVEADHFTFQQPGLRRGQLRIEQALPRIDEIAHGQFTLLAVEGRIIGKIDAFFQADGVGHAIRADFRQRCRRGWHQLGWPRQVFIGEQCFKYRLIDQLRIQIAGNGRVETGFRRYEYKAQYFVGICRGNWRCCCNRCFHRQRAR